MKIEQGKFALAPVDGIGRVIMFVSFIHINHRRFEKHIDTVWNRAPSEYLHEEGAMVRFHRLHTGNSQEFNVLVRAGAVLIAGE